MSPLVSNPRRSARLYELLPSSGRELRLLIESLPPNSPTDQSVLENEDQDHDSSSTRRRRRMRDGEESWGRKTIAYRPRKVNKGTNQAAEGGIGVQPWQFVKSLLERLLGGASENEANNSSRGKMKRTKPVLPNVEVLNDSASEEEVDELSDTSSVSSSTEPIVSNAVNTTILSITIPHGLQLNRHIPYPKPIIRNVLYIPAANTSEMFVVLEDMAVSVWRGGARIRKEEWTWVKAGVIGWCWIEKRRCFVVAVADMTLRVLDHHFEELSVISNSKPILFLDWIPEKDELVTGEVGTIKFWTLAYSTANHRDIYTPTPHFVTTDLSDEEWVSYVLYDRTLDRCFAAVDTSIYVYDWNTGERLERLTDIHDMSITCLTYYEPGDVLITGSKDGKIKIWSPQFLLLHTFAHLSNVTALLLIETGAEATWGTVPIVMSTSTDGTIRMWDFDIGVCLYRLDVHGQGQGEGLLGMKWVKKDLFWIWGRRGVSVWALNRYHSTFTYLRTRPKIIRRLVHPRLPPRILTACEDGSVKLISPVTGHVLVTSFPVHKDVGITDVVGDLDGKKVYTFMTNGDVVVYDVAGNPGVIVGVWEDIAPRDRATCITGLDFYNHPKALTASPGFRKSFYLGIGLESGGIGWIGEGGLQEGSVQAHIAEVTLVRFDPQNLHLVSGGKDNTIKIWYLTLTPPCAVSISLLHTLSTPFHSPTTLAIAPERMLLGLHIGGAVTTWKYDAEVPIKGKWGEGISDMDWCTELGIWATAERGGVVRIWDEGGLVREIQFNEAIPSIKFANARGDLLVSLSDQITLVRMQDYLPHSYLKRAAHMDFSDDPQETPLPFDTSVDFWERVYEKDIREKGEIGFWHVKKDVRRRIEAPDESGVISDMWKALEERRLIAQQRRNRRVFLEQEHRAFLNAPRFERFGISTQKATKAVEIETDDEDQDLVIVEQVPSLEELVDIIRPESPTENALPVKDVPASVEHILSEVIETRKRPIKSSERRPKAAKRRGSAILRAPNQPVEPTPKETIEARRMSIRKKLQFQGVAMPNSTLAEEVGKMRRTSVMLRRGSIRPPTVPATVKYIVPASRTRVQRKKADDPFKDYEIQKRNINIGDLIKVQEELFEQDRMLLGGLEEHEHEEEEVPPPPSPPMFEPAVVKERVRRKRKQKKKKEPKSQVQVVLPAPPSPPPAPKVKPKELKPPKITPSPKRMTTVTEYEPILPKVVAIPQLPSQLTLKKPATPPPPTRPKSRPPSAPAQPKPQAIRSKPTPVTVDFPESWFAMRDEEPQLIQEEDALVVEEVGMENRADEPLPFVRLSQVKEREAANFTWNMIRAREFADEDIPEGLRRLMGMFWFPHLKGKQVTLPNIVAALVDLLKTGLWLEKVEASKALLFLYHTFSSDFLDPMAVLIRPQLECLWDENWQVRAQLCSNVSQYGIVHQDILMGLVVRLGDENEHVRTVAMTGLLQFGVNNKEDLRSAMMKCGMLPTVDHPSDDTQLDEMIVKTNLEILESQTKNHENVQSWLNSVPRVAAPKPSVASVTIVVRRDSYYEHLAGPFFPADANARHLARSEAQEARARRAMMLSHARSSQGLTVEDFEYMDLDGVEEGWDTSSGVLGQLHLGRTGSPGMQDGRPGSVSRAAEPTTVGAPTGNRRKRPLMRSAIHNMRPLTAGSIYAQGGQKGLVAVVQPTVKPVAEDVNGTGRPGTAPVYGEVPAIANGRNIRSASMVVSLEKPWPRILRSTFPPVDPELHDRPFRA
ncbi:hypothetical protein SpCBS45565_g03331 [Spizellomyces sp. 'palustris']|nr:hypothetical protein SpCBS45565_g03331 [Spizellomyces sp. 'palustris']